MTTRILTLIAAVPAASLAAQDLPADPAGFADLVAAGTVQAATLFDRGCPSDNEWSGKALAVLEARAESDMTTRTSLAGAIRDRIADCPQADRNRAKQWAIGWVSTEYAANRWPANNFTVDILNAGAALIFALGPFTGEDRIQALARKLACDARLVFGIRQAANSLLTRDRLDAVLLPGGTFGVLDNLEDPADNPKCRGSLPDHKPASVAASAGAMPPPSSPAAPA